MNDLGYSEKIPDISSAEAIPVSPRIYKPGFSLSTGQVPELSGKSPGDKIYMKFLVSIEGQRIPDEFEPRLGDIFDLRLEAGEVCKDKPEDDEWDFDSHGRKRRVGLMPQVGAQSTPQEGAFQ